MNTNDKLENVIASNTKNSYVTNTYGSNDLIVNDEDIEMLVSDEAKKDTSEPKNAIHVKTAPKTEPVQTSPLIGDDLLDGAKTMQEEAQRLSTELAKKQEDVLNGVTDEVIDDESAINDIITSIETESLIGQKDDSEDLEALLEKMESEKTYTEVKPNKKNTGPAQYIIEKNDDYESTVQDILTENNIVISKKNAKEREAILDKFTNAGTNVSVALVNSGMFVQVSGAGTAEIIAMHSIPADDSTRDELNKLTYINKHIVGSSIGQMKLSQLIKVVSYYDKDTLYYALFAGTYPAVTEHSRVCQYCGSEFFMKINTRDLLLNPDEFVEDANDIRNNVTTYTRLVEKSELGKVYKKAHSNGMIVYYKHPSIESYLTTNRVLTEESLKKHKDIYQIVFGIDKIAIHANGNEFIEVSDPNQILDLIASMKNADEKYEIIDMIESIRPNSVPAYGYKEVTCPHCGRINPQAPVDVDEMLFTFASREETMASFRWMARKQKTQRSKTK